MNHPTCTHPTEAESHAVNVCPSCGPFGATFFVCFLLVISLLKMAPKDSAKVLLFATEKKHMCSVRHVCQISFVQAFEYSAVGRVQWY